MDQAFLVPQSTTLGHRRLGRHLHVAQVAWRPCGGLRWATKVLTHRGNDTVAACGALHSAACWCICGAALVALGNSKQCLVQAHHLQALQQLRRQRWQQQHRQQARAISRPAVANENAGKIRRLSVWPPLLVYVILRLIHQKSLRVLAVSRPTSSSFAVIIAMHAIAFLIGALVMDRRTSGNVRQKMGVLFAVFVADGLSWEALCHLGGGHIAMSVSLLSGLMLPLTMAASRWLLGRKFALTAWAGAGIVAAGVGYCNLGNPLAKIANMKEAGVLVAACLLPCLSLVGKEGLLSGSQRIGIPTVGLLTCLAQLVAILRPHNWPPTLAAHSWTTPSALQQELAALWQGGSLTYVVLSGLVRVALLVLRRAASASTLQLVNALAVPLGAAILTAGLPQNVQALLLASGGGVLYLLGQRKQLIKAEVPALQKKSQQRKNFMEELMQEKNKQKQKKAAEPAVPKQSRQRKNFMDELRQEKNKQKQQKAVEPAVPKKSPLRKNFMDELKQEKKKQELKKAKRAQESWQEDQEQNRIRQEAQKQEQRQQRRLRRMQARWKQQEEQQREGEGQRPSEPLMYADDEK